MALIGISGKIGSGKDTVGYIIMHLVARSKGCKTINWPIKEAYNSLELKSGWQIKKYAYKLKQIASLLTGIPVEDFEKQEVKDSYLGEEWNKINKYVSKEFKGTHQEFDKYIEVNKDNIILSSINQKSKVKFGDETYGFYYMLKERITKLIVREFLQKLGTDAIRNNIHSNTWINALFADYKEKFIGNITRKDSIENKDNYKYPSWIITDVRFPNEAEAIIARNGTLIRVNRENNNIKDIHPFETALDNFGLFTYKIDNNGTIEELIEKVKEILIKEKII